MAKIFYDHLTIIEELGIKLDQYEITEIEKTELIELADENMHHRVLNVILKSLPQEKHQKFLTEFHENPHNSNLLEILKSEIKNIEEIISNEAKQVKKEILAEIKHAQRN